VHHHRNVCREKSKSGPRDPDHDKAGAEGRGDVRRLLQDDFPHDRPARCRQKTYSRTPLGQHSSAAASTHVEPPLCALLLNGTAAHAVRIHSRSHASFRRPQCDSLRSVNARSTFRFSARSMPIRACFRKSRPSAAPISCRDCGLPLGYGLPGLRRQNLGVGIGEQGFFV
jgi:hypothetical protein